MAQRKQEGLPCRLLQFLLEDPVPLLYHNEPLLTLTLTLTLKVVATALLAGQLGSTAPNGSANEMVSVGEDGTLRCFDWLGLRLELG